MMQHLVADETAAQHFEFHVCVLLFYVRAAIRSFSPGAQAYIDTACLLCLPSPQCKLQQTGVILNTLLLPLCTQLY